jgi:hypothetical protein
LFLGVAVIEASAAALKPIVVTEPIRQDADDPAIWVDRASPSVIAGADLKRASIRAMTAP